MPQRSSYLCPSLDEICPLIKHLKQKKKKKDKNLPPFSLLKNPFGYMNLEISRCQKLSKEMSLKKHPSHFLRSSEIVK